MSWARLVTHKSFFCDGRERMSIICDFKLPSVFARPSMFKAMPSVNLYRMQDGALFNQSLKNILLDGEESV